MPDFADNRARTDALRDAMTRSGLEPDTEHPCPYLDGRPARNRVFRATGLPRGVYQSLLDLNFRRSGTILYQPACPACRQCQQMRVNAEAFRPSRAQRRCRRRNTDLSVELSIPFPTREKFELYRRYLRSRHDNQMSDSWRDFTEFLYESPVFTLEVTYRLDGWLLAVGLIDVEPLAISTVYCYFDPDETNRSLGVHNVLWTIDYCRRRHVPYTYLGYYIRDSRKMNYKTSYRPCEVLLDNRWVSVDPNDERS